jgi:hypothetical protein
MIMDEFKVHLMLSCLNALQDTGTDVDFVVGGYTNCVQILDKGVNRPFKGYARENFEHWMIRASLCDGTHDRRDIPSETISKWKYRVR